MMRCPCGGVSGTSTRFSQQRLAAPAHLSHVPAGDRGTHAHVLRYRPAPDSQSELCARAAKRDCLYCGKFLRSRDLFKCSKRLLIAEMNNILVHLFHFFGQWIQSLSLVISTKIVTQTWENDPYTKLIIKQQKFQHKDESILVHTNSIIKI